MLKAGKAIKIDGKSFSNVNAIQVAPMISIHGLRIKAGIPIPEIVQKFLSEKRIVVQQIEEDGDNLIRISGHYSITAEEIKLFLEEHPEIQSEDSDNEQKLAVAKNFQRQLKSKFDNLSLAATQQMSTSCSFWQTRTVLINGEEQQQGNVRASAAGDIHVTSRPVELATIKPSHIFAGLSNDIRTDNGAVSLRGAHVTSGVDTEIAAGAQFLISGASVEDPNANFGLLGEMLANKNINISSGGDSLIQDSVVRAGDKITIQSTAGTVEFSLNPHTFWENAPETPSLSNRFEPVSQESLVKLYS